MEVNDEINDFLEKRVFFALSRFSDLINRVHILVADENGPKGGSSDKKCRIIVVLKKNGRIMAEDQASVIEEAIAIACDRIQNNLVRHIKRKKFND